MKFEEVAAYCKGIPFTPPERGRILYDFVRREQPVEVLELGFAHGVSTCYIAAALEANGTGYITTIDKQQTMTRKPSLPELAEQCGLVHRVRPILVNKTYNWALMRLIEQHTNGDSCTPYLDFCFIDGAHSWETDGLAFFLVAKLLRPGAWICFDDLFWTYGKSAKLRAKPFVAAMPEDERNTPQVERVFSLLVRQHPDFDHFEVGGDWPWGWARKAAASNRQVHDSGPIGARVGS
jgi:predicted O-methyltransferase YrrM